MTDTSEEPGASPGGDRGRSGGTTALRAAAVACLVVLGTIKLLAAGYGIGIAITGKISAGALEPLRRAVAERPALAGSAAAAWYGANAVFALSVAVALHRRRPWGQVAALVYGGLHAFGFAGLLLLGPIVLINGVLGVAVAILATLSGARGAFAAGPPPEP